jgi:hypothetical protein
MLRRREKSFPLLGIEPRILSHPSHSLVAVPTEVSWLLDKTRWSLLYICLTTCFIVSSGIEFGHFEGTYCLNTLKIEAVDPLEDQNYLPLLHGVRTQKKINSELLYGCSHKNKSAEVK